VADFFIFYLAGFSEKLFIAKEEELE